MLKSSALVARQLPVQQLTQVPVRHASSQVLKTRIATVGNVKKITSTMKMVAAAKLRGAQRVVDIARVFSSVVDCWPDAETEATPDGKHLIVGIASDKGLCGGVNSSIVRAIRDDMKVYNKKGIDENVKIVLYGQKATQGLERIAKERYVSTVSDNYKTNFTQSCLHAELITEQEYDSGEIWFQYFRNMMAYDTTKKPLESYATAAKKGIIMQGFQRQGHPLWIMENFHQFKTATNLFLFQSETEASTLASRMAAMEGSSKNAGEMLESLTTYLNRTRQAKITTELIEIISGASAAAEMEGEEA